MKVNICGIPHEVIDVDYIESDNGGICVGQITYEDCIIKMRKGINSDYYRQTLIHEMMHGILSMIGRNDLTSDETFVQSLALAISQSFDIKEVLEEVKENV